MLAEYIRRFDDGVPFSLVMIDVDHFKRFNDSHGHKAGDEVLRRVGKCLSDGVRRSDFVARYGGEEFCILFSNQGEARATELAERVRLRIEQIESPFETITASMGVASFSAEHADAETLIRDADMALYQAKEQGRNRVVPASHCPGTTTAEVNRKSA